ncbi:hypothetical protein BCR35DRAFT_316053 [Leucosporidium creatinivorum]|uniref:Uncharacterized protein n=1 Tax=Leucosporidium creatinivorum TaxID=106004 RepID=A0A1Y2D6T1_9BASI|nr:hypothetical protein BCR35DRAFT_316053 [Leucosporidium creatinivorum]
MVRVSTLTLLGSALLPSVLAQASTTSSSASSSSSGSATSTRTSSAASSSSTSNSTSSTSQAVSPTVELPPLVQCAYATFSFTCPEQFVGMPKHLGFYPSTTSNWIETYDLPSAYDSLTEGSFTWLVDLPVGLSVAAMFYVTDTSANGAIPGNGSASTSDGVVIAGTSSSCLAQNVGASTTVVVSYASKFDPTFVWSASAKQTSAAAGSSDSSSGGGGSSTPIGAIVGGVVGGIAAITIIAVILFYLKRKHDRQVALRDDYSVYSGRSAVTGEKRGSGHPRYGGTGSSAFGGGHPGSVMGVPASEPPPGTYWGVDESGNTILLAIPGSSMDQQHGQHMEMGDLGSNGGFSNTAPTSPVPRQTAAMGTLPEPMGDESTTPLVRRGSFNADAHRSTTPPPSSPTPPTPFTPQQEPKAYPHPQIGQQAPLDNPDSFSTPSVGGHRGAEGLDDPNSFSPMRQTVQRSDTGFFSASESSGR